MQQILLENYPPTHFNKHTKMQAFMRSIYMFIFITKVFLFVEIVTIENCNFTSLSFSFSFMFRKITYKQNI